MKLKEISAEEFALEAGKYFDKAQRAPLIIRSQGGRRLILQQLSDDVLDELLLSSPSFRASIRRARQNRTDGKGIGMRKVRELI
jgi:hypothetical protein